jgi:hypothetical protein
LDWKVLTSRTVLGTCLLSVTYQVGQAPHLGRGSVMFEPC